MLKHFLATFIVQFDVSQFGHNFGQQSNSVSKWQKAICAALKCAQCNVNKMAAAPCVDLDGVDAARTVEISL